MSGIFKKIARLPARVRNVRILGTCWHLSDDGDLLENLNTYLCILKRTLHQLDTNWSSVKDTLFNANGVIVIYGSLGVKLKSTAWFRSDFGYSSHQNPPKSLIKSLLFIKVESINRSKHSLLIPWETHAKVNHIIQTKMKSLFLSIGNFMVDPTSVKQCYTREEYRTILMMVLPTHGHQQKRILRLVNFRNNDFLQFSRPKVGIFFKKSPPCCTHDPVPSFCLYSVLATICCQIEKKSRICLLSRD